MSHQVSLVITPQMKAKLLPFSTVKSFKEGAVILNENANIRAIPIVLEGSIRVMRADDDGHEIFLYYIKPGESCIMSFLGGIHHETSIIKAIAEEDVEILFIPIEHVPLLIQENKDWLDYIFKLYHKRFEELLEVINALAFQQMDVRILHFLKEKVALAGQPEISITHQQIADELATARVVVSRLLKQMEANGLVQLGRNKIVVL